MTREIGLRMVHVFSLFRRRGADKGRVAASRPSARHGVDRHPLPPPDGDWTQRRCPPRERDQVLSFHCRAWLATLPAAAKPTQLCAAYPAVANRIALCWRDPVLTARVFDDLLLDRRGGRQGFPKPVASELLHLRLLHARRQGSRCPYSPWDHHAQALSDR
jgi:hypothetical protein